MNYRIDHIPKNTPYNRRPGISMQPEFITIHSTANPTSTAQNERDWLVNKNNQNTASWHIAVDENQAVEAIPLDEVAWHAGDGRGTGNMKSIAIEICESGNREKTLQNAVKLVVKLLKERGWGISKLRRHYDWSGKNCPRILNYNNWEGWTKFKNDVEKELENMTQKLLNNEPSAWAKEAWKWGIEAGITDGSNPQATATRQEVVVMIYRAVNSLKKG